MKLGDLVYYSGPKHYTIDHVGRVGIVIKVDKTFDALKRRRVVFGGSYECNMNMADLEVINESR